MAKQKFKITNFCADLSLSGTTDAQTLPGLINQTHRKIRVTSADGAYDTRNCHDAWLRKKISPLIPPRSGAQYWCGKYHERNHAVANQHLSRQQWRQEKESGLSPSFSGRNGDVPHQNLVGWPSEPAGLWRAGGWSDGDTEWHCCVCLTAPERVYQQKPSCRLTLIYSTKPLRQRVHWRSGLMNRPHVVVNADSSGNSGRLTLGTYRKSTGGGAATWLYCASVWVRRHGSPKRYVETD